MVNKITESNGQRKEKRVAECVRVQETMSGPAISGIRGQGGRGPLGHRVFPPYPWSIPDSSSICLRGRSENYKKTIIIEAVEWNCINEDLYKLVLPFTLVCFCADVSVQVYESYWTV